MKTSPARIGLVICAVLGLLDVVTLAGMGRDDAPPLAIGITGAALGVITLAAATPAWRANRAAVLTVIASRLLSALLGIPVFFTDEAPGWARVTVGVVIAATIVGVWLLAAGRRPSVREKAA